jgi:polysaccharide pyruvyl transferase WcaK-like protein
MKQSITRVVVAGEVYSDNIGDPILCQGLAAELARACPDASLSFLDISARIEGGENKERRSRAFLRVLIRSRFTWLCSLGRALYFRSYLQDVDLVVVAGGHLFMDRSQFPQKLSALVGAARRRSVAVGFFACGANPDWGGHTGRLMSAALRQPNVHYVGVRDPESREIVQKLAGIAAEVNVDPAFGYAIADRPAPEYGVGFIVMHPKKIRSSHGWSSRYIDAFYRDVLHALPSGTLLFSAGSLKDREYLAALKQSPTWGEKFVFDAGQHSADAFIQQIAACKLLISFRLHPCLMALRQGIPVLPIGGEGKTAAILKSLGLPAAPPSGDDLRALLARDEQDWPIQAMRLENPDRLSQQLQGQVKKMMQDIDGRIQRQA